MVHYLRKSKYLNIIQRNGKVHLAYHKLYGNITTLNDSSLQLLSKFDEHMSPDNYHSLYSYYYPYIQTFYNMYYLVEDGFDERIEVKRELKEREKELKKGSFIGGVQLSVSDVCNFSCKYCFCDFVDKRDEERIELSKADNKLMSFKTAEKVINTLIELIKSEGNNKLVVKFFGREPLTNWPLIKRVMNHFEDGENYGIHIYYALTTNGSLVSSEMARDLGKYKVRTTVSIDGMEDSNDSVRVSKTDKNTFEVIQKGIDFLARHNAIDAFSAVLTYDNFESFDTRFIDFAHKYQIKEIQILLGMQGEFIKSIDSEDVADKLFDLYVYSRNKGIALTGYWHNSIGELFSTRKLRNDQFTTHGVVESCTATGYQISVEPSGDIFPCRAMSTYFGNISDFRKALQSDNYKHVVMRTYGNVKDCYDCSIEGFCQGVCLGNLEEKHGDIYKVDPTYCDIYRKIAHKILFELY